MSYEYDDPQHRQTSVGLPSTNEECDRRAYQSCEHQQLKAPYDSLISRQCRLWWRSFSVSLTPVMWSGVAVWSLHTLLTSCPLGRLSPVRCLSKCSHVTLSPLSSLLSWWTVLQIAQAAKEIFFIRASSLRLMMSSVTANGTGSHNRDFAHL